MEPQLFLVRLQTRCQSQSSTINSHAFEGNHFTGISKWDVNHPFHLAMLEKKGILQTYTLETTGGESKAYLYPCSSFQLHIDHGVSEICRESEGMHNFAKSSNSNNKNSEDGISSLWLEHGRKRNEESTTRTQPLEQAWGSFEFIPNRRNEIVFFQDGSSRVLLARLPGGSPKNQLQTRENNRQKSDSIQSKVYCIGRHSSTILSIAMREDGLVLASAARDGQLRVWRISDGSMLCQTMVSRWRQPHSPHSSLQGNCTKSTFIKDNVDIDSVSPTMQILSFLGKSSEICMGCPNGEVRIWTLIESENAYLEIEEVQNIVAGNILVEKDVVTSLAVHVPDCNFPMQDNNGDNQTRLHSYEAFIAIGTMKQKLQVWNKHTILSDWIPLWSTTLSIEGASIVSLSFRADGGLLAVAASRSGKPMVNEYANSSSTSPSTSYKQPCDCLFLYSASSWECVGQLNFTSSLGSCSFYHPHFVAEDKDEPSSCLTQDKVWSCRLLLVSTYGGPQTHILPEYGLFSSAYDQCGQPEIIENSNGRKEAKNVQWADHKGKVALKLCPRSYQETQHCEHDGEGDGSYERNPMASHLGFHEMISGCVSAMDPNSDKTSQTSNQKLVEDEQIGLQGLRRITVQKHNPNTGARTQSCHPLTSDAFKARRSKQKAHEANLVPRNHPIAKKSKFKNPFPSGFITQSCKHCKLRTLNLGNHHFYNVASNSHSSFSSKPSAVAQVGRENILADENIAKVEESCLRTSMDATTTISHADRVETTTPFEFPCQNVEGQNLSTKTKKEVTFINLKTPEIIPNHHSSKQSISHSRKKREKGHLGISPNMKSSCSKKKYAQSCQQQKPPCKDKIKRAQRCKLASTQPPRLGGAKLNELLAMNEEKSPFHDIVRMGGTFRERLPSNRPIVGAAMVVDPTKPSPKDKLELNRPVAFSTTSLMQKLQDIEHETFNLEAALQVAKAKGIVLSKYDREAIKAALEEEVKERFSKCKPEADDPKPSARYIPLLKIPDPRIAYTGPLVAPRKVRKQIDVKGEDLPTIQPALFDLWDLHERCPQVSSANLEQANTFTATSWRKALGTLEDTNKNSVWVQREDVCRAAASAQAIYDSCLYKLDPEPKCQCYERDPKAFNVR